MADTTETPRVSADDAEAASKAQGELDNLQDGDYAEAAAQALASLSDLDGIAETALEGAARDAEAAAAADAAGDGASDKTTLLGGAAALGRSAELTRELPGKGSAPAIDRTRKFEAYDSAPLPAEKIRRREAQRDGRLRRRRRIAIAAVVAVLAVAGAAGALWWQGQQERAATGTDSELLAVPVPVKIAGLATSGGDGEATGSLIPLQVTGQDAEGALVDFTAYVDEHGNGLELMRGSYTVSAAASPIAADGTVYRAPDTQLEIDVERDGQDYSAAGELSFTVPSADTLTDSEIEQAYEYASKGGASSDAVAKILEQAAENRRDAAVRAAAAQGDELRAEADELHKATDSYSFDLPRAWYGKVFTQQNGDTVYVKLTDHEDVTLCTLTLEQDGFDTGDANDGVLGSVSLGNGYSVVVRGPAYPWVVARTVAGKTKDPVGTYGIDEAVELVRLQTGDTYTYDQIKRGLGGKKRCVKLVQDYLATELLPSIQAS